MWFPLLLWYIGMGVAFVFISNVRCVDENGEPCVWYKYALAILTAILIWPYLFYKSWEE